MSRRDFFIESHHHSLVTRESHRITHINSDKYAKTFGSAIINPSLGNSEWVFGIDRRGYNIGFGIRKYSGHGYDKYKDFCYEIREEHGNEGAIIYGPGFQNGNQVRMLLTFDCGQPLLRFYKHQSYQSYHKEMIGSLYMPMISNVHKCRMFVRTGGRNECIRLVSNEFAPKAIQYFEPQASIQRPMHGQRQREERERRERERKEREMRERERRQRQTRQREREKEQYERALLESRIDELERQKREKERRWNEKQEELERTQQERERRWQEKERKWQEERRRSQQKQDELQQKLDQAISTINDASRQIRQTMEDMKEQQLQQQLQHQQTVERLTGEINNLKKQLQVALMRLEQNNNEDDEKNDVENNDANGIGNFVGGVINGVSNMIL